MAAGKSEEMKEMKNGKFVDDEEDESPVVAVVPPDGGWGWVVMIAAFFCNVIVDGIIFSFGLVLSSLERSFGAKASVVAWVASLLSGFYLLAGPFVSLLANRYGFRVVACAGSALAALSLAVASQVNSIGLLYLFVGVLGGIGFGLVYVPAVIAVGFYFEKRRALATGIAVCGSGIGAFVLAPLTTWLLDEYGWRGTLLIHAGLIFNCAIFGLLFRPLEAPKPKRPRLRKPDEEAGTPLMVRMKRAKDESMRAESADHDQHPESPEQPDTFVSSTRSLNNTVKLVGIKVKRSSMADSAGSLHRRTSEREPNTGSKRSLNRRASVEPHPLDRADAFYAGSLQRLPEYRQDPENFYTSVTRIPEVKPGQEESSEVMRTVKAMMLLFKSITFDLLCISSFITFLGFFVPFMYLAARAAESGIDNESASFLLSIIGITNTIGRVVCGALSDHPKVNVLLVNNAALTLGGLVTIFTPFFPSYEMLVVYACLFGLSIACFASLRSIIQVELLGLENLTNAFGLCLLFTGFSAMLGGPLAGFLYDSTQNYDASFYVSGSLILFSGMLCYPLGCINRWEKRRTNNATSSPQQTAGATAAQQQQQQSSAQPTV